MPNRPKKCSERFTDSCGGETDGCCGIIPCIYCLEFEVYGDPTLYGTAEFIDGAWTGTIAGASFRAYWERVYGDCEHVVEIDGEEVDRQPCGDCKDMGGDADVTIGYDSGTLKWTKYEPRQLPLITTDDGCRDHFCGNCNCTCKKLCAVVAIDGQIGEGILSEGAYTGDCDDPEWTGTITAGYHSVYLRIELRRDDYTGGCLLGGEANGETLDWVSVSDCQALSASWELYDGTQIGVHCEKCGSCDLESCCEPRCLPLVFVTGPPAGDVPGSCENPLPVNLTIDLFSDQTSGSSDACFDGTGSLVFKTVNTGGVSCWEGTVIGTCMWRGKTLNWSIKIFVCCTDGEFTVSGFPSVPCQFSAEGADAEALSVSSCDPVLIDGCFGRILTSCFTPDISDINNIVPGPNYSVCFQIYEGP